MSDEQNRGEQPKWDEGTAASTPPGRPVYEEGSAANVAGSGAPGAEPPDQPPPTRPFPAESPGSHPSAESPPSGFQPPPGSLPGAHSAGPTPSGGQRGRVQRQEPGVTRPRQPSVAEARARDKSRKQAREAERAAAEAAAAKKRTRNRVLIGGAAVVGVAALVGGGYLAYLALSAPDDVTASCIRVEEDGDEVVVEDSYCGTGRPGYVGDTSSVVLLAGWPQYRYYYGGTATIGSKPTGGTTVKPKNAQITTKSGTVVQRGGLGSKIGGGS